METDQLGQTRLQTSGDAHHIQITLPDGSRHRVPAGSTAGEALKLSGRLSPDILAVKVNGRPIDLALSLMDDAILEPITFDSPEGKEVYRHSSTHIMAQAVKDVFPSAQLAIGPAIEEGFYYDFGFERPFTPEDLQKIEARANEIIKADHPFARRELPRQEAIRFFKERD
ncbi:MAG TPA: TGS domain-containing protein, partial [Nitrospiraceae bacterium]|nr:TGS domain-containing protein [Nitrospiraceae bacterium]